MKRYLKKSKIQCVFCKDIIESTYRHDFRWCSCKRIYIDGGTDYQRVGFQEITDFVDMSEYEEVNEE
jgi:hypothetical protein